jgi:hypothetical protein
MGLKLRHSQVDRSKIFVSLLFHTGSGAHKVSYLMAAGDIFPGDKAAGADHCPVSKVKL